MPPRKYEWISCINFRWKLYLRDGVWYGDGRPRRGRYSLGTSDPEKARRLLSELDAAVARREQNQKTNQATEKNQPIGIQEGWERFIENGNRPGFLLGHSPATTKKYRLMQRRTSDYFFKRDIRWWNQLTEQQLVEYGKFFDGKLSPRSIHHEIVMLISVANWLIRERLLPPENRLYLRLRKPEGSEAFCYSEAQVTAILNHCCSRPKLRQLGMLCHLLSHTGMRLGEALALEWEDVNFSQGFITVRDESFSNQPSASRRRVKDKCTRQIPIAKSLRELLQRSKPKSSSGLVFRSSSGRPLLQNNLREQFRDQVITPLAKLMPRNQRKAFSSGRFHTFRHYFVSQCFIKGVNEGTIRSWLGHSDSRILELYRHLAEKDSQRLMQKLNFTGKAKSE